MRAMLFVFLSHILKSHSFMGDSTGTILIFSVVVGLAGAAYWYFNQERRKAPKQMGCLESKPDPAEVCPSRAKFLHVFASAGCGIPLTRTTKPRRRRRQKRRRLKLQCLPQTAQRLKPSHRQRQVLLQRRSPIYRRRSRHMKTRSRRSRQQRSQMMTLS